MNTSYDPAPDSSADPSAMRVAAFAARQLGVTPDQVLLRTHVLRGGLESAAVTRWVTQRRNSAGQPRSLSFVVKRLDGFQLREAAVYARVLPDAGDVAPALLGYEQDGSDTGYLYLEYVRPTRLWPWTEMPVAGRVLESLGMLHMRLPSERLLEADLAWNYEAELLESAAATLEVFERVVRGVDLAWLRWGRGALRRTCDVLPLLRQALMSTEPFGTAIVHGDVHSGNAMLVSAGAADRLVLLDWARARLGSPLEDVASWLQSLGYWEPEAKRRHDTLLRHYLSARGRSDEVTRSLRDAYWFAAASNVLAGALRYHLAVAAGWSSAPSRARAEAARAARDHLRVLRRADLLWRG